MKKNEVAFGTLKQSQVRDSIELSIRFKRQRAATEALHKLAREKGVELVIDAIHSLVKFLGWKVGCVFITSSMLSFLKIQKQSLGLI